MLNEYVSFQALIVAVELDEKVVEIANRYFSFPSSDARVRVKCMDAIDYLKDAATAGNWKLSLLQNTNTLTDEKLDVLLMDLAGSTFNEQGLSCPPAVFLEDEVLTNTVNSIKPDGE